MEDEKETASNLIAEISWSSKCAKEQADMLGYTGYQKEYHIRKTIAEALARIGYRKVGEVHEPKIVAFEIPFAECSIQPVGENLYQIGYECPICGKGEADCTLGRDKEHAIERFKRSMNNYCPHCGARLKEVKE